MANKPQNRCASEPHAAPQPATLRLAATRSGALAPPVAPTVSRCECLKFHRRPPTLNSRGNFVPKSNRRAPAKRKTPKRKTPKRTMRLKRPSSKQSTNRAKTTPTDPAPTNKTPPNPARHWAPRNPPANAKAPRERKIVRLRPPIACALYSCSIRRQMRPQPPSRHRRSSSSFPGSAWERTSWRLRLPYRGRRQTPLPRGRASQPARSQAEPGNEGRAEACLSSSPAASPRSGAPVY